MDATSIPLVNVAIDGGVGNKLNASKNKEAGTFTVVEWGKDPVTYKCTANYRGASSMNYAKKSLAIKLVDAEGGDLDAVLLGIRSEGGGDNSWILDAMAGDPSRLRNRLCMDLWNDMGRLPYDTKYGGRSGTQGKYVEVYFDGEYHGLYCLSDKIDRKLLDLKKEKEGVVKGALYKGQSVEWWRWAPIVSLADTLDRDNWELQYPKEPSDAAYQPLFDLVRYARRSYLFPYLDEDELQAFEDEFPQHFDLDNVVDYAAFLLCTLGRDQIGKNWMLSIADASKGTLFAISPWDCDETWGRGYGVNTSTPQTASGYPIDNVLQFAPFCMLWRRDVLDFRAKLEARIAALTVDPEGVMEPGNLLARMRSMRAPLVESGAWQREVDKWNGADSFTLTTGDDDLLFIAKVAKINATNLPANLASSLAEDDKRPKYELLRWQPWPERPHLVGSDATTEAVEPASFSGAAEVSYSSTNDAVATVALDEDGKVVVTYTGRPGGVQIVACATGGCYTESRIDVVVRSPFVWDYGELPAAPHFAGDRLTLPAATAAGAEVRYASSDPAVATVAVQADGSVLVELLAAGEVRVEAATEGDKATEPGSVGFDLTVEKVASPLVWDYGELPPAPHFAGDRLTLPAATAAGAEVRYASSDPAVATVAVQADGSVLVELLAAGEARVEASTEGDKATEPGSVGFDLTVEKRAALNPLLPQSAAAAVQWRDLTGRPVAAPSKGLYIGGGRLRRF